MVYYLHMEDTTIVYMTPEQVALFILFQKYYDSIAFMISQNVFEIKHGSCTLHFNSRGALISLDKHLTSHLSDLPQKQV